MKAIVLTFDCLPLRLLGCYGNETIRTPHLDRLAADSIVFDSHFGENFDAAAANHAWWTGRHQFPLTRDQQLNQPSIAGTLAAAGVELRMVCEQSAGTPPAGDGELWRTTIVAGTDATPSPSSPSSAFILAAQQCLEELPTADDASWLLWLQASGVSAAATARNEVEAIDHRMGELLDSMAVRIESDNVLFILTASKGADVGERRHGSAPPIQLYDSLVHVPLMVRVPQPQMGSRRNELTQSVDIVPTLLDWFGIEPLDEPFAGRSLLTSIRGEHTDERDALCLGLGTRERGIRTRDFYLVETFPIFEDGQLAAVRPRAGHALSAAAHLFKKPDDQFDIQDLAHQFPEMCDELSGKLNRLLDGPMAGQNRAEQRQ